MGQAQGSPKPGRAKGMAEAAGSPSPKLGRNKEPVAAPESPLLAVAAPPPSDFLFPMDWIATPPNDDGFVIRPLRIDDYEKGASASRPFRAPDSATLTCATHDDALVTCVLQATASCCTSSQRRCR